MITIKTAYFEITNKCNLNCITCYNRSGNNNFWVEIPVDFLRKSINLFINYGLERVLISGGEPTLHSDFENVLMLVNEFPQLTFGIVTNGTIHNQQLIDALCKNNNFTLQISLDGSSEELNSKTRGIGNFNKTLEFARRVHNKEKRMLLKIVISQNNIEDIENFYRLAVDLNFIPEFAYINRRGNACDEWSSLFLSEKQKFKILTQINELNKKYNGKAFLPLCTNGCSYAANDKKLSLCIKSDGSIQPCSLLYDSIHSLGNIFKFDEEYFLKKISNISKQAAKRETIDYNCDRCILRNNCKKGCMASAYILNGDLFANDGECNLRKMQLVGFDLKFNMSKGS